MLTVEQPARRGPSGIWVVTGWEMLQPGEPSSLFDHLYPDFTGRQVEQVAPPSDAEATALLQAFLGARVDGEGAEQYLLPPSRTGPRSQDEETPLLYATTSGAPYERSEIERLQGPVWPTGWTEFRVRLFAEGGTVVEQSFAVIRERTGASGSCTGYPQTDELPDDRERTACAHPVQPPRRRGDLRRGPAVGRGATARTSYRPSRPGATGQFDMARDRGRPLTY